MGWLFFKFVFVSICLWKVLYFWLFFVYACVEYVIFGEWVWMGT